MKIRFLSLLFTLFSASGIQILMATEPVTFPHSPKCSSTPSPWSETFENATFPPTCWTLNLGSADWVRSTTASSYGVGSACAMADFYNITGNTPFALISFPFTTGGLSNPQLTFDYAYATYDTQVDQLDVFASTNSGGSYTLIAAMPGGLNGILNTGGATTALFVPTSSQWATFSSALPAGTNTIAFNATSAYGNNLYLDNIRVTVPMVHDVGVLSINAPPSSVVAGTSITPSIIVINTGTYTESFTVSCQATDGYSSTQTVSGLVPGSTREIAFDNWTPLQGDYSFSACTSLSGDANATNNCISRSTGVYTASWSAGSPLPAYAWSGAGATYTNTASPPVSFLFSLGGITPSGLGTECYKYNLSTNAWSSIASLPEGRKGHAAVCSGNYIYVIGGYSMAGTPQKKVYRYSISGNSWTTVAQLPVSIADGKALAYGTNSIYLAGGTGNGGTLLSSVYYYNISTNSWSSATSLPAARSGGAFAITGTTLVYVGGNSSSGISNTVYCGTISGGNPLSITWSVKSPYPGLSPPNSPDPENDWLPASGTGEPGPGDSGYPPGSFYRFEGSTWGSDGIIVAGGSTSTTLAAGNPGPCYRYLPGLDAWFRQPDVPKPVAAYQAGSVSDASGNWKLVIAGGVDTSGAVLLSTQIMADVPVPPTRTINLSVFLEGLYTGNGSMNPASGTTGPYWGTSVADHLTINLINSSTGTTVYSISDVPLPLTGGCSLSIPWQYNGSYYIYLRHRNSVVTSSSSPVSLSGNSAIYSFDGIGKAYGNNLKVMTDGHVALFAGDVNQDGAINESDLTSIGNSVTLFQAGYLSQDVNGDGITDTYDFQLTDNNCLLFVHSVLPF